MSDTDQISIATLLSVFLSAMLRELIDPALALGVSA